MTYTVYLITHRPSGLRYVGLTKNCPSLRFKQHPYEARQYESHTRKLMTLLSECDVADLDHSILECNLSREEAFRLERHHIDKLDIDCTGLNSTSGGGAFDANVYKFVNLDGSTFVGTRSQLCMNLNVDWGNMSRVIAGKQASCTGWLAPSEVMRNGSLHVFDVNQHANISSWVESGRAGGKHDTSVYIWTHKSGDEFTGSRFAFAEYAGLSTPDVGTFLWCSRMKTFKGWLKPVYVVVDGAPMPRFSDDEMTSIRSTSYCKDDTPMVFQHDDGRVVRGLRSECRRTMGLQHTQMSRIVKGYHTVKGWRLKVTVD